MKENMLNSSEKISVIYEGIPIEGVIYFRNRSDLSVIITSPFSIITSGLHIPYYALGIHNFLGDYGDQTAKKLLIKSYRICSRIEAKKTECLLKVNEYLDWSKSYDLKLKEINEELKILKQKLRSNEITDKQYEKSIKTLRNEKDNIGIDLSLYGDKIFCEIFTEDYRNGLYKEIIEYIKLNL